MTPPTVRTPHKLSVLLVFVALAATLTLGAGTASAALLPMSPAQLTDASAQVLVVRALGTHSRWTHPAGATYATKGTIVTDVRCEVYQVLKGRAAPALKLTVPGGAVGRASMPIPDAPRFAAGRMYVVFLDANAQIIAWREGQPRIVGDQVPALGLSLKRLKATIAARTGRKAELLRPWTPRQTAAPSTSPLPAAPTGDGTATAGGGTGAALSGMGAGGGVAPAGGVVPRESAPSAPADVQTRAVSTLFWDDFESLNMNKWTLLYHTPVVTNECYFSNSFWEDDQGYDYMYAYSAAQRADYYLGGMWFWAFQMPYPGLSYYGNNDDTWMITKNSVNLSGYSHAVLNFDLWLDTAGAGDQLGVWFSTDGSNFSGPYWYGQEGSLADPPYFSSKSIDLTAVPTPSGPTDFCGNSQVWVGFHFGSDSSGRGLGGCVDNVELVASNSSIPVITDVSPPSAPSGTYLVSARNQSRVTITGSGFGSSEGKVAFFYQDGEPLITAPIVSWSGTQIVCDVPIGTINGYPGSAGSGPVYVKTAGGAWSGGFSFDVPFAYGDQDWEASRCLYRVNMGAGEKAAVDAACQSWTSVGSQMQFADIGACTTNPVGTGSNTHMPRDGHNDMCFGGLPWPGVIAAAFPFAINGRILETDICFNTTGGFYWGDAAVDSGAMDIRTIALHETGHWLNLRDLYGPGDTARVMYGFCGEGVVKRNLTTGDHAGIDWIYADHSTDTAGPVTKARSLTVTRGKTAKVKYTVADPFPSIGVATGKVEIKKRSGAVVKAKSFSAYTRFWYAWSFRCRLARGRYTIEVTATDLLGNPQTSIVKARLTVR